ncbi:MAG: HypC/HybG/HupF family hydrogenase formation chaperone [Proteobacteria bacterium]|nr:HypC/HybG/HupF family hydrogenase formation chaperone [Pseudomonadota bacterium]
MCLAIPVKIVELMKDNKVKVDAGGAKLEVSSMLMPSVKLGEYVLVHAGFIIEKVSEEEAKDNLGLWSEIEKAR